MLAIYREMAEREPNTSFVGHLATYRYLDMHHVIDEALQLAQKFIDREDDMRHFQKFGIAF